MGNPRGMQGGPSRSENHESNPPNLGGTPEYFWQHHLLEGDDSS